MIEYNLNEMIPAYNGDKPYIFISYSHKDSEFVREDIRYMNSEGYHIWYDEGIEIGKDWPDELATAIQNCTQFIVYISRYSIKSEHVKDEIFYALNNNKKVVPVYLEDMVLPSGLGLKLGSKQGIMQYQLTRAMYNAYLCKALYLECREPEKPEPQLEPELQQESEPEPELRLEPQKKEMGSSIEYGNLEKDTDPEYEEHFKSARKEKNTVAVEAGINTYEKETHYDEVICKDSENKDVAGLVPGSFITDADDISVPDHMEEVKQQPHIRLNILQKTSPRITRWLVGVAALVGLIATIIIFSITNPSSKSGENPLESTEQNTNIYNNSSTDDREGNSTIAATVAANATLDSSGMKTSISELAGTNTAPSRSTEEDARAFTPDEYLEKLLSNVDVSISVEELTAQIRKKLPVITEVTTISAIDTKASRGYALFTARKLLLQSRITNAELQIQDIQNQRIVLAENKKRCKSYIIELATFNKNELVIRTNVTSKLIPYLDKKLGSNALSTDEKSLILNKKQYLMNLDNEIRSIMQEVVDLRTRHTDKITEAEKQDITLELKANELTATVTDCIKELEEIDKAADNAIQNAAPKYH